MATTKDIFTILHLSDLHRNEDGLVKNDQLLTSLILDADNYTKPNLENIPRPSVIIISGDIIYGSHNSDEAQANLEIQNQYNEATNFLNSLVTEFLDGDKSKIIIIPGNHDIQWKTSKDSMEKIDHTLLTSTDKKSNVKDITDPKQSIRWSWNELNFYKIEDESIYNSRLKMFSEFYESFYEGKRIYSLDPDEQYEIFDIPYYNLTVVGYNSSFRNDHLNRSGLINTKALSASYNGIREYQKKGRLLFAAWHHNFSGIPSDDSYLDPRQLKSINSYGFLIGFHGHQHHSDIVMNYVQFENSKKLIAISAGTLCSAKSELPTGFKRQYNLLKINYIEKTCELFSRESIGNMDDIPIWNKGRINESMSSNAILEIDFPDRTLMSSVSMSEVDDLIIYLKSKNYGKLLELLNRIPIEDPIVRNIIVDFSNESGEIYKNDICRLLNEPEQFSEYILFLDYFVENGMKKEAAEILNKANTQYKNEPLLVMELNKYTNRIYGYRK